MGPAVTASSNRLAYPGRLLWGVLADAAIFVYTVLLGGAAVILTLVTRKGWPVDVLGRVWSRWIIKACGIQVEVEGLQHVQHNRSYVIVSNHLSNFDIWATLGALPLNIRFVAKKELLRLPVFGQALAVSNHIVIDRAKPDEAIARINAQVGANIDEGFCILFYAEGTRSQDGRILPFKKGGVTLAMRAGLPVIPMSVSGTRKFLPKGCVVIRPGGRVKIVLGEPIDTAGLPFEQRETLNERVRDVVIRNFIPDY